MFQLGQKSKSNLVGVHPLLRAVVMRAIEVTQQDFTVFEGPRTLERQKKLVASGASKTLKSMHIPQPDVYGKAGTVTHAVDLVPWIDGQPRWEWGPTYVIAAAVRQAAEEQGVTDKLNWGGVWDRWMSDLAPGADAMKKAVNAYVDRRRAAGRSAFIDGPHFQIGRMG